MKAKTKLTRLWGFLLALVMIVGMLPTTALAAAYQDVGVNGIQLRDASYLADNSSTSATTGANNEPSNYVAWYKNGVLTLNGYNGKYIQVSGALKSDLTVKLKGSNTITSSYRAGIIQNGKGGSITVTADNGSSGKLTINATYSHNVAGIDNGTVGSDILGDVTIKGYADVIIKAKTTGDSSKQGYGIYAKNAFIQDNASVNITCETPNRTSGELCYGIYAKEAASINTAGKIKIDVTKAGTGDAHSYGINVANRSLTLTKAAEMVVEWRNGTDASTAGAPYYPTKASFNATDHAINVDKTNCYASYRYGEPRTVTVNNGKLTGPGVKYANDSGYFLAGDKVNIKPNEKKSFDGTLIPFKEWTSEGVALASPTTPNTSFNVPTNDVTVTATHSPFVGKPTFTRESEANGTIAFKTAVKPDNGTEYFQYVEVGKENDPYAYNRPYSQPTTISTASPYEYSVTASTSYTTVIQYLEAGDYRMAVTLNGERYLSDPFTVDYTAPVTTYTVSFNANGGTGTMADVTGVSGEYTLPANGFTAPDGKQFKGWATSAGGSVISGTTYEVSSDTTFYAIWESKEYSITVTDGKATIGAGSEISKAAEGTAVTLTANAAPSGKVFDKWEVVSGGITLADANSATTTFTMPASAVSVKATYKTTPVTTYNLTTQVNGGHGTISAGKTGLTAGSTETITFNPEVGYEIDTVTVNGTATSVSGNTLNVTMNENKTVVVTYKAIEYNITVTDGKATVGAGTPITKATMGTTVTLTANAAPSGKVFDKWEVVSGGITLADANSATTTFTMPASAVSVKATYKTTPVTTYNLTTQVNGGHGTISASKTGLTAGSTETITFNPEVGYEIDTVTVNGTATSVSGNTLNVTMNENKTVVVTYKAVEYNITVTDGKATIGAGSEISKATMGTAVTLTANAAPSGKVFDKWEVVSGGITLADVNSATTTFTMPAEAVSVKATYKNAPHTHTYNQETVKPEALKTPADCTNNAVYFKSCSCGAISTTDTFVAMDTALGHAHGSDWKYDSTNHWHECSRCHDKKDEAAHDYGSDNVCDTCGYDKTVPHTHNLTLVPAKAATCTNPGNSAYYTCDGCDKWFEDATGSVEITDKTSVKIPAPGHTAGTEWKSDDTNHWHECTVAGCGVIIESTKSAHTAGEWIVDTPATATTAGTKHKECMVCHRVLETQTIPSTGTELKIIAGDNQIYNKASGSDVTITCNGDFAKFTGIKVDGSVVDSSNYTAVSGSTVLTLKASYIGTLTDGSHTITFVYTDGEANANLTVRTAGSGHIHDYGTEWKSNADNHWHECNCGDKKDEAAHSFKWVVDKEATATKKGSKHEECKICGYKRSAVEIPATGTSTAPTDTTKPNDTTKPGNTNGSEKSPQTGDNSNIFLWFALLFVSAAGVTGITAYNKKKKEHAE